MSADVLCPPIIVVEGLDVSVYPSLESAMLDLEGIDVADGVYSLFDAEGRRIHLRAEDAWRRVGTVEIGSVRFGHAETVPTGADELCELLQKHLTAVHVAFEQNTDLPTLVRLTDEFHRS